jgi:flagellar hook-basal body complex protein FliE
MDPISSLKPVALPEVAQAAAQGAKPASGFGTALARAIESVNASQRSAEGLAREFQLENSAVSLEQTVLAANKANIGFQTLVQVRNRVVAAYHDIMNMQV